MQIKTAKALLTDPTFQTQSILGNASIVITPETFTSEPDTFLVDQYDFNERSYKNLSRDPNMTAGQKLLESFGQASGPYGIARNVAQYFGSDEGDPSSKQYIIQINEDTPELQGGLVETPYYDEASYQSALQAQRDSAQDAAASRRMYQTYFGNQGDTFILDPEGKPFGPNDYNIALKMAKSQATTPEFVLEGADPFVNKPSGYLKVIQGDQSFTGDQNWSLGDFPFYQSPVSTPIRAERPTAKPTTPVVKEQRSAIITPEGKKYSPEEWDLMQGKGSFQKARGQSIPERKQGGMEQQRFSKEDLAFMRALREQGVEVTFSGYKNDSPDRNNAANLIPSGNITMENVDKPVFAMDSKGNSTVMQPGQNYKFPGNAVLEIPMMQLGGPESNSISNLLDAQDAALANDADFQSYGNEADVNDMGGAGFNMSTLMAVGSGISQISNSLAQLGPESSTEVGSVSGMGGSREQAVEGTIGGTLSSIPIVGQFYQIGSGIGSGFEAGANAFYAEGNQAGGEAMTAMQGIFNPSSQFGRNAELWEAGYISDAQAVGGLLGGVIFGGAVGMDRRVREIADRQYKGAMTRATGGMHIAGTPSAESAGKFSKATGYPKPKRT